MITIDVPILVIAFKRPELLDELLERIGQIFPKKVLFFCDAPNWNNEIEVKKSNKCKNLIEKLNWDCEMHTYFPNDNLGAKLGPYTAINWAMSLYEEVIIVEDDFLPDISFFSYCQQLLLRYKNDDRVMSICGYNPLYGTEIIASNKYNEDYYFSHCLLACTWATWRRAWQKMDLSMKKWKDYNKDKLLYNLLPLSLAKVYTFIFSYICDKELAAWDYQWLYSIIVNGGVCIIPHGNLVKIRGFGEDATHTVDEKKCFFSNLKIVYLNTELRHPLSVDTNDFMDELVINNYYKLPNISWKVNYYINKIKSNVLKKIVLKNIILTKIYCIYKKYK
ncbi:hypothetical protein [Pectinatus frisingensis]|uniref:hypothetical protein n=1 Tax=Pectinatus frisingensis TaxID=865 RepID=UPI0018C68B0F|nr:hypothetical protein [Pectinatus frisingensis]